MKRCYMYIAHKLTDRSKRGKQTMWLQSSPRNRNGVEHELVCVTGGVAVHQILICVDVISRGRGQFVELCGLSDLRKRKLVRRKNHSLRSSSLTISLRYL